MILANMTLEDVIVYVTNELEREVSVVELIDLILVYDEVVNDRK